jgi:hypothetical protein
VIFIYAPANSLLALEVFESIKLRLKKEEPQLWLTLHINISHSLIGLGRFIDAVNCLNSVMDCIPNLANMTVAELQTARGRRFA